MLTIAASALMPAAGVAQVPPPPVVADRVAPSFGQSFIVWSAEPVRCGDAQPILVRAPDPAVTLGWGQPDRPAVLVATFRIDASGRPLGIARVGGDYLQGAEDVLPALAAARFAPGPAQASCTMRFTAERQPVATAPTELVWQHALTTPTPPSREVWRRFWPAGSTCFEPTPAPLLRAFPDFKALSGTPGRREWTEIGFDLDAAGRPVRVKPLGGSANAALDAAGMEAVAASRFEKGARTGCVEPFFRNADPLTPPEPPSAESLAPAGATCPRDMPYARQPTLTFPESYRKRSIEGWAVLAFDVAPWGQIGNVRVLAAEPTAEFGDWAKRVLGGASKAPSNTGYVGCVDRVLFKLGPVQKVMVRSEEP